MRNSWQGHDEAVKEFRRRHIGRALEVERTELIGCGHYERTETRRDYRAGYWKRWITMKDGGIQVRMPKIRGLTGAILALIITDGHAGLNSVVDYIYPKES